MRLLAFLWILVGCTMPLVVGAHTDLSDRIDILNHKIQDHPDLASLYIERGTAYRHRGEYNQALKDYQMAEKLAPENGKIKYQQGLVLFGLGQLEKALTAFNAVIKTYPGHVLAVKNRARVLRELGDHHSAAIDYRRTLDLMRAPKPADYLEVANNYLEYGHSHYGQATLVLDEAIKKLGPLVQLQARAIDIDLLTKNYQSGLQRVTRLMETLKGNEKWMVKKAGILSKMGEPDEAMKTYQLALKRIGRRPNSRRNVKAIKDLELAIGKAILDLQSGQ